MSARPKPAPRSGRLSCAPEHRLQSRAASAPAGYAMVPNHVTRNTDLPSTAHRVLTALIGLCRGNTRCTRASIRKIAEAAGVSRHIVRRAFPVLEAAKLIVRRSDPDAVGSFWMTHVLCDPKGLTVQDSEQTMVNGCAIPAHRAPDPSALARSPGARTRGHYVLVRLL